MIGVEVIFLFAILSSTGLWDDDILPTVLARSSIILWEETWTEKSCTREKSATYLDSGHIFCQWKNCLLPRCYNWKSILENSPWRKGSAEHSVSSMVSITTFPSLRAASLSSVKQPLMFRCVHHYSSETALHHVPSSGWLRLSVSPWDTLSPLSPQNDCFGCCRQITHTWTHTDCDYFLFQIDHHSVLSYGPPILPHGQSIVLHWDRKL